MRRVARLFEVPEAAAGCSLVLLVVIFAISSHYFLTTRNINDLLVNSLFVLFVAVGMSFVIIAGGIDLSVGSTMALAGCITGLLLVHGFPAPIAVVAGLAGGAVVGLVNGLLITRLGLADFIVTLVTLSVVRGIVELITANDSVRYPQGSLDSLVTAHLGGASMAILYAAIIVAVMAFVARFTRFGRSVFAVGMNPRAAHLSGINVRRPRLLVYVLSGLLAATSGIFLASYLSGVQPVQGNGYEMTAIAAAAIGGTSLAGGKGSVIGAALGAILLTTLQNGLLLLGLNAFWFQVITGLVIIVAVGVGGGLLIVNRSLPRGLWRSEVGKEQA